MNESKVLRAVAGQIEWWWTTIFRPRLEGLTQDEFLWEPTTGCWSIHPAGDGRVAYDFEWPPPHPAPVTTIGWRLCHIGVGCLAVRSSNLYPDLVGSPILDQPWSGPVPFPETASDAVAFLDEWWYVWTDGLRRGGEDGLWESIGDRDGGGDYPEMQLGRADPVIGLVLHIHR